ncbi:hypothetical protein GCM10009087_31310 [Sphingomonas oligophenolica]
MLAKRYEISPKTVAKWKKRTAVQDLPTGPTDIHSFVLNIEEEAIIVAFYNVAGSNGNAHLQAMHPQTNQGICADAIASMEGISREQLDQAGYASQQRAAKVIDEGRFNKSIVPVLDDDGAVILAKDEYPRPTTTLESLAFS